MKPEATGEFPIPSAVPHGDGNSVDITFKPEDIGAPPSALAPDGTISLNMPADKWGGLPDDNKRTALRILAGMQDPFLARRNRALGLDSSQPDDSP